MKYYLFASSCILFRSASMSAWDILPPEGAEDSAGAGSGAGTGSAGSVGSAGSECSAGALAASSFSMSSWDILPPEGARDSAGAGSGAGTGSAGSVAPERCSRLSRVHQNRNHHCRRVPPIAVSLCRPGTFFLRKAPQVR